MSIMRRKFTLFCDILQIVVQLGQILQLGGACFQKPYATTMNNVEQAINV